LMGIMGSLNMLDLKMTDHPPPSSRRGVDNTGLEMQKHENGRHRIRFPSNSCTY